MRSYFYPLLVVAMVIGTSCQPEVNAEKEKEAILAVIKEEAEALKVMDKERVYATHIRDSDETRLELGVYGYNIYQGWDKIESLMDDYLEGYRHGNEVNTKENVILKVTGNNAWLTCDNVWKLSASGEVVYSNIQIVFLEKVNGEWKISFSAYYNRPTSVQGIAEPF
jgi:hypothetical protein